MNTKLINKKQVFGFSTELITSGNLAIVNRFECWVLTFRTLAHCSDEGLMLETSALKILYGGQFTLSTLLRKPNIHFYSPPRSITSQHSLETVPLIHSLIHSLYTFISQVAKINTCNLLLKNRLSVTNWNAKESSTGFSILQWLKA